MTALETCESKRAFPTRWHARIRALQIERSSNPDHRPPTPLYTYQCDVCGRWHLTRKINFQELIEINL